MLVDGSSGRTPEVAPGAGDEDSAEATQPTTRRVPRPQRIVRALTIALACLTGVGVLLVLVKLRAARRGTARVPSRSAPHAKTRRWLVRAALSAIDLRRRPPHGERAQHAFHPTLVVRKSDRRVRHELRTFAQAFAGEWRYSTKPTSNDCRSFQVRLLQAVGLDEGPEHRHTRGTGCPFLSLFRTRVREFAIL